MLRIHVVSDGSSDNTANIARSYAGRGVVVTEFAERRGKAAALADAIAASDADIVVFCDVRQRLENDAVGNLVAGFADPAVGAISGELLFERSEGFADGIGFYWRYEKQVRIAEAAFDSAVGATGALYAIRRELADGPPSGTILDDVYLPMCAVLAGKRVLFARDARAWDQPAESASEERRRKVRTAAGVYQLVMLRPALMNPFRNRIWWQFVSHKILRVLSPFVLLALFVLVFMLAATSAFYAQIASVAVALSALALAGLVIPALASVRVVQVLSAFATLNWFALLGFGKFLVDRESHLWTLREGNGEAT